MTLRLAHVRPRDIVIERKCHQPDPEHSMTRDPRRQATLATSEREIRWALQQAQESRKQKEQMPTHTVLH